MEGNLCPPLMHLKWGEEVKAFYGVGEGVGEEETVIRLFLRQ